MGGPARTAKTELARPVTRRVAQAPPIAGRTPAAAGILELQRTIGNQATLRLAASGAFGPPDRGEARANPFLSVGGTGVRVQRAKSDVANYLLKHREDPEISEFFLSGITQSLNKKRVMTAVTRAKVISFVNNTTYAAARREAVGTRWNTDSNKNTRIAMPAEFEKRVKNLKVIEGKGFAGYDSDDEPENMDIKGSIDKSAKYFVNLFRGTSVTPIHAPVLAFPDAVRYGRQIVKHSSTLDGYKACLPIVTEIGGKPIEYNSPGTLDIYAYPLDAASEEEEESKVPTGAEAEGSASMEPDWPQPGAPEPMATEMGPAKPDRKPPSARSAPAQKRKPATKRKRSTSSKAATKAGAGTTSVTTSQQEEKGGGDLEAETSESPAKRYRYSRSGAMADHAWLGISNTLTAEKPADQPFSTAIDRITGVFKGKMPEEMTAGEAVATGAIGSDLMKGVAGGMHYLEHIEANRESQYSELFSGKKPLYKPAQTEGGRAHVRVKHGRLAANRPRAPRKTATPEAMLVESATPPTLVMSGQGPGTTPDGDGMS